MGLQPLEKSLVWWINSTWKPKGHFDLQLGSKGFFTFVFFNVEEMNQVMDGKPYFFYSARLFLKPWKENFFPKKEYMRVAPVWIRLYSLPGEY